MTYGNTITIDLRGNVVEDDRLMNAHEVAYGLERIYGTMANARRDGAQHIAARMDAAGFSMPAGYRADDSSASMGMFGARELEQRLGAVRQEVLKPLNAERLFQVDSSIAAGVESYRIEREYGSGRAALHKAGAAGIPRVSVGKQEEVRYIKTIAVGFDVSIFELASAGFAGFNAQASMLRNCRRAIDQFANEAFWYGIPEADLYGVLDFPWTAKYVAATSFSNANIEANPDDIIAELNFIVQEVGNASGGALAPDSIAMPIQLKQKLASTRITGRDYTILKWWLENNGVITDESKVHGVHELKDAGGAGVDCIYAFRADGESNKLVMPERFNQRPVQEENFNLFVPCYGRIGGFYAVDGNNLLAFVDR